MKNFKAKKFLAKENALTRGENLCDCCDNFGRCIIALSLDENKYSYWICLDCLQYIKEKKTNNRKKCDKCGTTRKVAAYYNLSKNNWEICLLCDKCGKEKFNE